MIYIIQTLPPFLFTPRFPPPFFFVSFRHSSFSHGPIDLTLSGSSNPCPRRDPLASATGVSLSRHPCATTNDVTRDDTAIPARPSLCSIVSAIVPFPVLPDYRDKQPEKPRWMTRHAVTVAPRDFRASIPRVEIFRDGAEVQNSCTGQWAKLMQSWTIIGRFVDRFEN